MCLGSFAWRVRHPMIVQETAACTGGDFRDDRRLTTRASDGSLDGVGELAPQASRSRAVPHCSILASRPVRVTALVPNEVTPPPTRGFLISSLHSIWSNDTLTKLRLTTHRDADPTLDQRPADLLLGARPGGGIRTNRRHLRLAAVRAEAALLCASVLHIHERIHQIIQRSANITQRRHRARGIQPAIGRLVRCGHGGIQPRRAQEQAAATAREGRWRALSRRIQGRGRCESGSEYKYEGRRVRGGAAHRGWPGTVPEQAGRGQRGRQSGGERTREDVLPKILVGHCAIYPDANGCRRRAAERIVILCHTEVI